MDCSRLYDSIGFTDDVLEWELSRFGKVFPYVMKDGSLYDAGCGEGFWMDYLSGRTDLEMTGSDISPVRLSKAKSVLKGKDVKLSVNDMRNLPYGDGEFDQVTSMEVLEHIPEWQAALGELVRVASKRVLITVPYNDSLLRKTCPGCGGDAYLYGHVNSFTERDFRDAGLDGKASYIRFYPDNGIAYYSGRLVKKIGAAISSKAAQAPLEGNGHMHSMVCQDCYDAVPYTPPAGRKAANAVKSILGFPQFLLVKIDK